MNKERRRILAALAVSMLPGRTFARAVSDPAAADDSTGLAIVDALGANSSLAALGQRYLADHPAECNLETLLSATIATTPPELAELLAGRVPNPARLRASVRRRHRADCESMDLVRIDGLLLTRTEARLCSLVRVLRRAATPSVRHASETPDICSQR